MTAATRWRRPRATPRRWTTWRPSTATRSCRSSSTSPTARPAGYSTDWSGSSAQHSTPLSAYDPGREQALAARKTRFTAPGEPSATRAAILTLVDTENPPLRLFLGEAPLGIATADYDSRLALWREWQPVAAAAQGNPQH